MPSEVTIYHNPRCSKSRQTLHLLRDRGIQVNVVEYLKEPLTADTLRALISALGVQAHDLLRIKEPAYKEAGLSEISGEDEIIRAIMAHPALLERPIVVKEGKAAFGRPPENALTVL